MLAAQMQKSLGPQCRKKRCRKIFLGWCKRTNVSKIGKRSDSHLRGRSADAATQSPLVSSYAKQKGSQPSGGEGRGGTLVLAKVGGEGVFQVLRNQSRENAC